MKSNLKYRKTDRQRKLINARSKDRRGVLLLVVLSILILFLLVGTTFILTAGQHRERAKILEKANRTTFQPEDVLERALMQLVRDTNNRYSAVRYHSLLRDVYGGDGFVAQVLMNNTNYLPRYAQVVSTDANPSGVTAGQLVDIYVTDDSSGGIFSPSNAVGLDIDSQGLPIDYSLSSNEAYYNGCLLTLMEGPCRGISVRIVDYDIIDATAGIARLRVMAPSRLDGQALSENTGEEPDGTTNIDWTHALSDFYDIEGVGYRFIVNGRPHNGTGVGYNAYAGYDQAKLTTLEAIRDPSLIIIDYVETALCPNSTYFTNAYASTNNLFYGRNPLAHLTPNKNSPIDDTLYPNFPGPGDTDESYDAPDYQNMFLAHQSVTPRFRGRLRINSVELPVDPAAFGVQGTPSEIDLQNVTIPSLHRPALVNFWFHRLFNSDWLVNAISDPQLRYLAVLDPYGLIDGNTAIDPDLASQITAIKRKYSMRPTRDDHPNFNGSNPYSENQLAARFTSPINGNTITAPSWEIVGPWDVDNDGDGVPDSVWVDLGLPVQKTEDGRFYKPLVAMLVEDLDNRLNLNAHGSLDHFAGTELDESQINGTLIKSNLAQDLSIPQALFSSDQLPTGMGYGPADITLRSILSPRLPLFDFSIGNFGTSNALTGNAQYDDYARLLIGRPSPQNNVAANGTPLASRQVADVMDLAVDFGRYGSASAEFNMGMQTAAAGKTFNSSNTLSRESRVPYDFAGYPEFASDLFSESGYGERPDLLARYASALSADGKQLYESKTDFLNTPNLPLLDDSPYELDLSIEGRRGTPSESQLVNAVNDLIPYNEDALFSPAELERILRATDTDAGELPGRLWDIVDAFDPDKSVFERSIAAGTINQDNYAGVQPTSLQRVVAQATTSITRRQVTTDSYSLPVPNENWTSRLLLGADGIAGSPNADDDGDGDVDEGDEVGLNINGDSDDYFAIVGDLPPSGARVTDFLRYRILLEFARNNVTPGPNDVNNIIHGNDQLDATSSRTARFTQGGMLAPEVLAGRKMNINRPFGDGRDNNGNGTVDEPEEAGEPYTYTITGGSLQVVTFQDLNGNGLLDQDIDGDLILYIDTNADGIPDSFDPDDLASLDHDRDGIFEFESLVNHSWVDVDGDGIRDPAELRPFNHTFGKDASGRGVTSAGNFVNDDAHLARQLYARHLYCLMLAVMDENYLAPYDENDPQILHYLDPFSRDSMAFRIRKSLQESWDNGNPPAGYPWPGYVQIPVANGSNQLEIYQAHGANAERIARRKLTCRQVAQWAINCVDMRDPDSVQTPFEYDENPWDGWNVVDQANGIFYSIDGDISTDENYGMYREMPDDDGDGNLYEVLPSASDAVSNSAIPAVLQTRGLVWGAERPELLLTEGLAWHDRRVQDLTLGVISGGQGSNDSDDDYGQVSENAQDIADQKADNDLDQQLKPAGRAFVEIYNPWTDGAALAAELYRDANDFRRYDSNGDGSINVVDSIAEGLLLDRASDAVAASGLPSPVWRMACTETHPLIRNATIPESSSLEVNDDPYTSNSGRTQGNDGKYLDLTIENGPWEYQTNKFNLRNPDTTDGIKQIDDDTGIDRYVFAGNKTLPKLPKAYLDFYSKYYDNTEDLVPLKTEGVFDSNLELAPRLTDPDFPAFDRLAQPKDEGSTTVTISNPGLGVAVNQLERRVLSKPNEYFERLYYFTGAPAVDNASFIGDLRDPITQSGLHIPNYFYEVQLTSRQDDGIDSHIDTLSDQENRLNLANESLSKSSTPFNTEGVGAEPRPTLQVYISRFPALDYFDSDGDDNEQEPLPLAPILPGRFAVVGSAGEIFGKSNPGDYGTQTERSYDNLEDRYTSIISQSLDSTEPSTGQGDLEFLDTSILPDSVKEQQVAFRRIEMIPSTNPFRQQFIFRMNGGLKDSARASEVVNIGEGGTENLVNVTDPVQYASALPDGSSKPFTPAIQPIVAVPLEDFSISEPLDGYLIRQLELDPDLGQIFHKSPQIRNTSDYPAQGAYVKIGSGTNDLGGYDEPFDLLPELIENQTTPNYRTMHLQRLANPRLAWNPSPISGNGEPDPQHDPNRPVNPYLTTDSLSLDLTSLNSTSAKEGELRNTPTVATVNGPELRHQVKRNQLPDDTSTSRGNGRPFTKVTLQSQERGLHGFVSGSSETLPSRTLWNQDRPTGSIEILNLDGVALDPNLKIHQEAALANNGQAILELEQIGADNAGGKNRYSFGTDEDLAKNSYRPAVFDYPVRHSLGFANRGFGKFYNFETLSGTADDIDVDGDSVDSNNDRIDDINGELIVGDIVGSLQVDSTADAEAATTPVFHWPNRPFISEGEIIQVPIWSSSRMLTYYSVYNAGLRATEDENGNGALNGDEDLNNNGILDGNQPNQYDMESPRIANALRWRQMHGTFGHLPNFFATSARSSTVSVGTEDLNGDGDLQPAEDANGNGNLDESVLRVDGAPHFYRILDYLHVPSRFIGTDTLLDPEQFASIPSNTDDPLRNLAAPFNRVDHYREPGKVNLNTVVGHYDGLNNEEFDSWSEVYDGIMHRFKDENLINYNTGELIQMGHLGPAWRDITISRRGYINLSRRVQTGASTNPLLLNSAFPTFFANPFRASGESLNVPIFEMRQEEVVASILRPHHYSPGGDSAWGVRFTDPPTGITSPFNTDTGDTPFAIDIDGDGTPEFIADKNGDSFPDNNGIRSDTSEAGSGDDTILRRNTASQTVPNATDSSPTPSLPRFPLMSGAALEPSLDTERNSHLRYQPITRLSNLTTTRSGVFAVWMTVGFFEVTPASNDSRIAERYFINSDPNDGFQSPELEDLFFRIYPDGYTLGREVGLDTSENQRHRGFYIVDRTRPVAFKPGEDLNVDDAILLRRRIE